MDELVVIRVIGSVKAPKPEILDAIFDAVAGKFEGVNFQFDLVHTRKARKAKVDMDELETV